MSVVLEKAQSMIGDAKHLGEFVRAQRTSRGWSQNEMAFRSRLPQGEVSKLECGHKYALAPSISMLERLANALSEDPKERGRLLRAMLLLGGMQAESLDAILTFDPAMNQERELVPA